jgi:hypothetical protein
MAKIIRAVVIALLALPGQVHPARIDSLIVTHRAGSYTVAAVLEIAAPEWAIRAALTDYDHLDSLSPAIIESRVVRQTDEGPLVYTHSRSCAGFFCRQLHKTERVTVAELAITAVILPEDSNVTHGVTRWRFTATATGTRVELDSEIDPAFFVPPLIGPPLVKSALRREAQTLATGLEQAARASAYPSSQPSAESPK